MSVLPQAVAGRINHRMKKNKRSRYRTNCCKKIVEIIIHVKVYKANMNKKENNFEVDNNVGKPK